MSKTFGKASDFYRVRIITLEQELPPDFDWRDDVLYRPPKQNRDIINITHCLQVVELDSRKSQSLKEYAAKHQADQDKKVVEEDLGNLTKMEFEKKYHINPVDDGNSCLEREDVGEEKKGNITDVPRNLF